MRDIMYNNTNDWFKFVSSKLQPEKVPVKSTCLLFEFIFYFVWKCFGSVMLCSDCGFNKIMKAYFSAKLGTYTILTSGKIAIFFRGRIRPEKI